MEKISSPDIVQAADKNADIPSYMQNSTNIIIMDHEGTLHRKYKNTLEREGYTVKCLNFVSPEKGNRYDPFHYIHGIEDIEALVRAMVARDITEEEKEYKAFYDASPSTDLFRMPVPWERQEELFLNAAFSYVYLHMPVEQKKITSIAPLIRDCAGDFVNTATSDNPFEKLREQCPDSYAVGKYIEFRKASRSILGEHYISILVSCAVRLQIFDHQVYHNVAIVTRRKEEALLSSFSAIRGRHASLSRGVTRRSPRGAF